MPPLWMNFKKLGFDEAENMINLKDSCVIDRFVAHLRKNGYPNLQVDRRPDEENRVSPDIDAIAGPFATEHTRIDTLPNQSRNNDWFDKVTGGLDKDLSIQLPFRLSIILEYNAITTNQDWKAIKQALKNWITNESPKLVNGHYVFGNIPDIPFKLTVFKDTDMPPKLVFSRFDPNDNTLSSRLKVLCDRKAKKLAKYQGTGTTTILLIENNDIALMHPIIMRQEIQNAYPNGLLPGVDKIWYADTAEVRKIPFEASDITFEDFTPYILGTKKPSSGKARLF